MLGIDSDNRRGVKIPDGLVAGDDERAGVKRFRRTGDGIVLLPQQMIDRLGA